MNKRNFELLGSFTILYIEDEADLLKHTTSVLEDFVKKMAEKSKTNIPDDMWK